MNQKRLRPRDPLDWISAIVDVAQIVALVGAGVGLLYWLALKKIAVVAAANSVMLILLLGAMAWLAVKMSR